MMAGDVDAFPVFPAPENLAQFEADPRFNVIVGSTEGETILAMNHGTPELADIRVRQAIAHAIDRQESSTARCSASARPSARISRRTIPTTSISPG
jgi:ABC-type transport system substrate-binding protein